MNNKKNLKTVKIKVSSNDLKNFELNNIKIDEWWMDLYIPNNSNKNKKVSF